MLYSKNLLFILPVAMYLCVSSQPAMQQFKRCAVKTINYEQGLLNNSTADILTDAMGFTWVSTQTGMQRYNGYVLEKINPVINKDTLRINSPVFFFALENGVVWISYKKGIIEYNPYNNHYKKIISAENKGNLNFFVFPLKETNEGVWCLDAKKGIIIYSKPETIKTLSKHDNDFMMGIFQQKDILVNTIYASNDKYIFLYDGNKQIVQIDIKTHALKFINTGLIYGLTCTENDLYTLSNSRLIKQDIQNEKNVKDIFLKKILPESINYGALILAKDRLLMSLNKHLYEADTSFKLTKEITNLNRNPIVSVGLIRMIYTDKHKRIWLLTNDDIKRIQNVEIPFEHLINTNEKNNFVRSIYYDEQKHFLLAGCFNGGIQLYDTSGNSLWAKALISDKAKDITGIQKLSENNYLIITLAKGWYTLNLPSKKLSEINLPVDFKNILHTDSSNFCNNIQRVDDNTFLIATSANVFECTIYGSNVKSVKPLLAFTSNTSNRITSFIYTSDNTLWAGSLSGKIYRLDKNKKLLTIDVPENYLLRSFTEDISHNVWAGTDKGLYVYSSQGNPLKQFTLESGLLNDCIYSILPANNEAAVFASSNHGLSYVSLNGVLTNYTKESGLQENEFNTGSAAKTNAGKFYFGGINGITSFYPASLYGIIDSPILNITKLVINNSLSDYRWKGDTIRLKYFQNHIQIDFAALGLLNTNEYQYEYRLTDFEEMWQPALLPTGIKYILTPGKYVLELKCRPILSSSEVFIKKIVIIVYSPWWLKWWFKTFLALVSLIIIIFSLQQYNRRKYLQRIKKLEIKQEIQHERERISRDLHDNLGAYAAAISSNIAALKDAPDENEAHLLHKLKNNSQSIISQLNDTIWALNKEAISLTSISDRFKIFIQKIQPNFPDANISIQENIETDQMLSPANALHLFRILQEAVNNALKHSNCKNIFIQINDAQPWEIIISDDGKGIGGFNGNFTRGNGLKNIKLRCEQAGWEVKWQNAIPKGTDLIIRSSLL